MAEELSWWADHNEKLIGFVFRDTRSVKLEVSLKSEHYEPNEWKLS